MVQEAYKNRKKEINDVVNFITSDDNQILLYESAQKFGNTAFISRVIFLYRMTPTIQIFSAELSAEVRNPIHAITSKLSKKNNQFYQQLQMFTDENYGTYEVQLFPAILKDISQSDTLAALFQSKSAVPIYTGFYQNRLKETFFCLINEIVKTKKIVVFIDNIQFMDNESIYELQALLKYSEVKLVCSKSGEGDNFDKFYYETKYKYSYLELPFPVPNVNYVKKLGEIYHKKLSDHEANLILLKSNKDVRKILFYLREPLAEQIMDSVKLLALKIISLYNDFMTKEIFQSILEVSPYKAVFPIESIEALLNSLEKGGYLKSLIEIDNNIKSYCIDSAYIPTMDIADRLILSKSLLTYYIQANGLSYKHLLQAWEFAVTLNEQDNCWKFAVSIIKFALKMGYVVDEKIILTAQTIDDRQTRLLVAIYLFCNAKYKHAKVILDSFISNNTNRAIDVIYAITLNRCRSHTAAYKRLSRLIKTSKSNDELAILVSFLISNDVHSNHLPHAVKMYETYNNQLKSSKKYPYFLRNAATIFEPSKAYHLRNTAKCIFKEQNDLFGYYSTIINLTSYNLKNSSVSYALSQALMAFEGLQQFSASQLHLAANNLGICYLMDDNYIEATKYFTLSIESAKTIMPKAYATFNLAAMYIKKDEFQIAYELITALQDSVLSSGLPRLKSKYYLSLSAIEYVLGNNTQALKNSQLAIKESNSPLKPFKMVSILNEKINENCPYSSDLWKDLYTPCFLEYWTINSIDVLTNELLPF